MTSLPKQQKIESSSSPLALIVGDSDITSGLARKLIDNGCEVIELKDFPKSGKFNYVFQFGSVNIVKDSYLKFLKPKAKYLFIDYKNEDIHQIKELTGIKILRIDNLNPWYFQKFIDEILSVAFTQTPKTVIDLRLNKVSVANTTKIKIEDNPENHPLKISSAIVQKKLSSPLKFFFFILFLSLILTSLYLYWQYKIISTVLAKTESNLDSGNYQNLEANISQLSSTFQSAKKITQTLLSPASPLHRVSFVKNTDELIDSSLSLISNLRFNINLIAEFQKSESRLIVKDFTLTKLKYEEFISAINNTHASVIKLKKDLKSYPLNFSFKNNLIEKLDSASSELDALAKVMVPFKKAIYSGKKDYLLLFQNNMELRATGGFIGSVGFLTLNNGRLENLEISDVYTIDGQLKGHVEPPPEIRKHFSQPNYFFRDSNFDPDFASTAIQAEWFLDKSIGRHVDGVIGINLFLIEDLLKAVGPVTLPDFNREVITSDNLFVKAQVFINQDFFAGSTQKKDFLSSVATEIQKKLMSPDISYLKILILFTKSLEEKNLIFYFNDPELQKDFENLGWAGRIFNVRCINVSEKCFPDYLSIIESNFGINKANYFVSKSITISKNIASNGALTTDLTLNYSNQSRENLLQGGEYTNYLRLFLPKSISFISASYNDENLLTTNFDISSYQNDKVVYGILLKVPQNSIKKFKFTYSLSLQLTQSDKFYQFYFQKQPGDKVSSLNLDFTSPTMEMTPFNFEVKGEKNKFSFQSDSSVDRIFQFKITN